MRNDVYNDLFGCAVAGVVLGVPLAALGIFFALCTLTGTHTVVLTLQEMVLISVGGALALLGIALWIYWIEL